MNPCAENRDINFSKLFFYLREYTFTFFNVDVQAVLPIVGQLRRSGVRVELELRGRKIGKAMSWANSIGADYTFVVGPRDLEAGSGMLKSLSSGEQTAVALDAESIVNSL